MNIRLTISNLCARAAMLLFATVISIGAWAQELETDLGKAVIRISNHVLINEPITINYTVEVLDHYYTKLETLEKGTHYNAIIKKGNLSVTEPISDVGDYTLTISGIAPFTGSQVKQFKVVKFKKGNGTQNTPFDICDENELDLLAETVNSGQDFSNQYFKLSTDIPYSNKNSYKPIGSYYKISVENNPMNYEVLVDCSFKGQFDGGGHTIKGIRISDGSTSDVGIFGRLGSGAEVKNLTLDDAIIYGIENIGGIVGNNRGGNITNCHVTSSVYIRANKTQARYHGGIVGANQNNGFVSYCTSAATLSNETESWNFYGGIVGINKFGSSLKHNLVIGATIPTASSKRSGAIAGSIDNDLGTTLTDGYDNNSYENIKNNYYNGCSLGTENVGIGRITNNKGPYDIKGNDGAVPLDVSGTTIILYDSGSKANENAATIDSNNGELRNVILAGRTFYKDGKWNTLCLPFDIDKNDEGRFKYTPLEGADVRKLYYASFDKGTGTLTLNFTSDLNTPDDKELLAGKPYIFKWSTSGNNLVNPVFKNVKINNADPEDDAQDSSCSLIGERTITFHGTYGYQSFSELDNTKLFLGYDQGKSILYYPIKGASIGAFRSYFELEGFIAGDPTDSESGQLVRAFNLNIDDDPSGITTTAFTDNTDKDGAWYSLDGRKFSTKPTAKGLYINKGKKIIIK